MLLVSRPLNTHAKRRITRMLKLNLRHLVLLVVLLYTSCDIDRFTSFDHTAKELLETIKIEGAVLDFYTQNPIPRVLVQVGPQFTITNLSGKFSVNHLLTDDDQHNRPVKINLTRYQYYPKDCS